MNTNINTNYMDFSRIFDSVFDTQPNATLDPFEQYLNLSLAASPTSAINPPPFDFDQGCLSQPTAYVSFSDTLNKTTEGVQLLFQEKSSLATVFSGLTLTDSYDMTIPLSLTQGLSPAPVALQALQLPLTSQLPSVPSFSSYSLYEDALGLTWPTSDVTFEDFDMQDLSFLDVPFNPTTAVATTSTTTAPLLDFQFQPNLLFPGNSDSHTRNDSSNNVMDDLDYSNTPLPVTTTTTAATSSTPAATSSTPAATSSTPANMVSYLNPCPHVPPLPQPVPTPASSSNSVNPFRTMANASNLFLPQMDTPPTFPHFTETAPGNLPLLWSTFPSVQPAPPPSQAPLPHSVPAIVLPAVVSQSTPAQDAIICQSYSPTAFVLDGSIITKKLASRRQSASATLFRRTSPPIGSANAVRQSSPYARSRYPQEPKKRQTSGMSDGDDEDGFEGGDDVKEGEFLKLQKTAEMNGAVSTTPMHINLFDASQCQHDQSISTSSLPSQLPPTDTSAATPTALNGKKYKTKGKSGRKPMIKKITDCAHYRPRNAFFMFRGFVSHIHTYLHAKQLSASSTDGSSDASSSTSSSCSMTSIASTATPAATRLGLDNSHKITRSKSDDDDSTLTPSSPYINFPTPYSDIKQRQQRPHLSLHLPPTTSIQSRYPPLQARQQQIHQPHYTLLPPATELVKHKQKFLSAVERSGLVPVSQPAPRAPPAVPTVECAPSSVKPQII
ncbi:hypothetical protein F5H01DRAFT_320487 [Linnemannia elongata]|nr:hypothetical protein F5H01DRAFT_320487 [Linnemannia elongata]